MWNERGALLFSEWRAEEEERQSSQMSYIPTRQTKWKILDQWRRIHL